MHTQEKEEEREREKERKKNLIFASTSVVVNG